MRKALGIILALAVVVAGCTGGKVSPRLVAIDSLIASAPDSACALLEAFPADSLDCGDNRPYHALLTTIAAYKAYRPFTTDSVINIALEHYDRSGADPDKRMRSLLYRGCVATELHDDTTAMRYYKLALQRCPASDRFHQGYIHFRIANLYHNRLENRQSIGYYRNAYHILAAIGEQNYRLYSCSQLGCTYRSINADSAQHYITLGIELAKEFNQPYYIYQGFAALAGNYFNQNDYPHARDWAMKAINEGADQLDTNDAYFFACQSFIELGNIDSAQSVLKQMPNMVSARDSLMYYNSLAQLAEVRGDKNAKAYMNICDSIDDAISIGAMNNGLVATDKAVEVEHTQQLSKNKSMMAVGIAILATLVLAVALLLWGRMRHSKREVCNAMKQIEQMRADHHTRQQQHEISNRISECLGTILTELSAEKNRKRNAIIKMPDGINGGGRNRVIIINTPIPTPHTAEPAVLFCTDTEVLTIDFVDPSVEYSVTVTNLMNNVYITFYDTGGVVPLPTDGFCDYLITIETTDGDVFEGTLYAHDYLSPDTY